MTSCNSGLAATEPELQDVMKTLRATKMEILWNVGLPRTMPYFFASLKVAATLAFVGTVISETVASNRGIGNLMMIASSSFDVPLVFAGLFILAALGVGLYVIFSLIEARVTGWATLSPTPNTVHWGYFDAALKPVATINPGDTITITSVSGAPDDLPAQPGMTVRPELTAIHAAVKPELGLDLSKCASTGATDDLVWVSPRTG
eukprot:gene59323-81206_t